MAIRCWRIRLDSGSQYVVMITGEHSDELKSSGELDVDKLNSLVDELEFLPGHSILSKDSRLVFKTEQDLVDIYSYSNRRISHMVRMDAGEEIDWIFEPQEPSE